MEMGSLHMCLLVYTYPKIDACVIMKLKMMMLARPRRERGKL